MTTTKTSSAPPVDDVIRWICARSSSVHDTVMGLISRNGSVSRTVPVLPVTVFLVATHQPLETGVAR